MNIVLVSGRYPAPQQRHAVDAGFAEALAARGLAVRWLRPVPGLPDGAAPLSATGLQSIAVASPAPPFRAVQGRLLDQRTETELTRMIRAEMADLVHILDYGGSSSVNVSWVGDRMGTRTIINMRAAPVLCHRGDFRWRGIEACDDWRDPRRCLRCAGTSAPRGLTPAQGLLSLGLGLLRSPVNPFPTLLDFVNRPELLVGGAQFVDRIVAGSTAEQQQLVTLGLREGLFEVLEPWAPGASIEPWIEFYDRVV